MDQTVITSGMGSVSSLIENRNNFNTKLGKEHITNPTKAIGTEELINNEK